MIFEFKVLTLLTALNRQVEPVRFHASYSCHDTVKLPLPPQMQVPCLFSNDGMAAPEKVCCRKGVDVPNLPMVRRCEDVDLICLMCLAQLSYDSWLKDFSNTPNSRRKRSSDLQDR